MIMVSQKKLLCYSEGFRIILEGAIYTELQQVYKSLRGSQILFMKFIPRKTH